MASGSVFEGHLLIDVPRNQYFIEDNLGNAALEVPMNLGVPKWPYLLICGFLGKGIFFYNIFKYILSAALFHLDAVNHVDECFSHSCGY